MTASVLIAIMAFAGYSPFTTARPLIQTAASTEHRVWIRSDGRRGWESVAFVAVFNGAKRVCIGDAVVVSEEAEKCMLEKGFLYVPESDAARVAKELAAKKAEKATDVPPPQTSPPEPAQTSPPEP